MSDPVIVTIFGEALSLIGEVIGRVKEKRQENGIGAAADALTIISAIVESVKRSPEVAMKEMNQLRRSLSENDDSADRALEDKFDKSEE